MTYLCACRCCELARSADRPYARGHESRARERRREEHRAGARARLAAPPRPNGKRARRQRAKEQKEAR